MKQAIQDRDVRVIGALSGLSLESLELELPKEEKKEEKPEADAEEEKKEEEVEVVVVDENHADSTEEKPTIDPKIKEIRERMGKTADSSRHL